MCAVQIENGSVAHVTFHVSGFGASLSGTADGIIAQINSELQGDGLNITTYSVGISGLFAGFFGDFSATADIVNQSGQELDDTDLTAQFADAVNTLGGTVSGFGITGVTDSSGNTSTTATGASQQQAASGSGTPQCGDPALTIWKYPGPFFDCLTQKGLATMGILFIGLIIGVILIVASEHKSEVAAAA